MDRIQEIRGQIKTIGDRATLLLGYLVIILATLTAFVFTDISELANQLRSLSIGLLALYSLNAIIMLGIVTESFGNLEAEEIQNISKLNKLKTWLRISTAIGYGSIIFITGFAIYSFA